MLKNKFFFCFLLLLRKYKFGQLLKFFLGIFPFLFIIFYNLCLNFTSHIIKILEQEAFIKIMLRNSQASFIFEKDNGGCTFFSETARN